MAEQKPRNLVKVLNEVVRVAPELGTLLQPIIESIPFTAPEVQGREWRRAAHILSREAPDRTDLQHIFCNFRGDEDNQSAK